MRFTTMGIAVGAIMLTGCTPTTARTHDVTTLSNQEYQQLATDHQVTPHQFEVGGFLIDKDNLALILYGSSSCPPLPVAVKANDKGDMVLDTKDYGDVACTADYGPSTYKIKVPSGVDVHRGFTVLMGKQDQFTLKIDPLP